MAKTLRNGDTVKLRRKVAEKYPDAIPDKTATVVNFCEHDGLELSCDLLNGDNRETWGIEDLKLLCQNIEVGDEVRLREKYRKELKTKFPLIAESISGRTTVVSSFGTMGVHAGNLGSVTNHENLRIVKKAEKPPDPAEPARVLQERWAAGYKDGFIGWAYFGTPDGVSFANADDPSFDRPILFREVPEGE